jgi:DNA-binding protein YbaB
MTTRVYDDDGIKVTIELLEEKPFSEIQINVDGEESGRLVEIQVTKDGRACSVKFCNKRVSIHADDEAVKEEIRTAVNRLL